MAIEHVSVSENVCALQICLVPSQYLFEPDKADVYWWENVTILPPDKSFAQSETQTQGFMCPRITSTSSSQIL